MIGARHQQELVPFTFVEMPQFTFVRGARSPGRQRLALSLVPVPRNTSIRQFRGLDEDDHCHPPNPAAPPLHHALELSMDAYPAHMLPHVLHNVFVINAQAVQLANPPGANLNNGFFRDPTGTNGFHAVFSQPLPLDALNGGDAADAVAQGFRNILAPHSNFLQ